jgi:hypothetical protein
VPNFVQFVNRRHHIPSQIEVEQSNQLIEQWKNQIASMKLKINNAEETLLAEHRALDNELEAKISSIRAEYKTQKEKLDEQSQLDTQPVRLKLEEMEKRLELECEFVSGLRKIPDEIVVEILQWHLQDQIPPRDLALVCKSWTKLLRHTPSFWRDLKAHFVDSDSLEREVDRLSKRIALSRSALLDITLSLHTSYDNDSDSDNDKSPPNMDLFKLIAGTGIERWRSLRLLDTWPISRTSLEGIFHGTASALQKLALPGNLVFSPIYRIILQSKPRIKEVTFFGAIPSVFQDSTIFQSASKVTANVNTFQQVPPFNNIQELSIADWVSNPEYTSLPPLAVNTSLYESITRRDLHSLQRQNVVSLSLRKLTNTEYDTIIDFPQLISLSLTDDGFASLERISAPKLANLELAFGWTDAQRRKLEISETMHILRNKPQNIIIRPTSLNMNLSISTTAVLAILQLWPQLQHLALTFGDQFAWKGAFPNSFTRKKNPLCPELVTLRLESDSKGFGKDMERWDEIAKSILATRKGFPLNKIEWTCGDGTWHKRTASN